MSAVYFWVDGEVVVVPKQLTTQDPEAREYAGHTAVDTCFDEPTLRYGKFSLMEGGENTRWDRLPFHTLPADFMTHLLLLGVSL